MNIQQFQYILAVADKKHFELAAEKCYISQSTLSTMISKFEEEIGVKIFDRKKKPVHITAEGAIIIDKLKEVTTQIGQLKELVKEIKGEIKGKISISVIPTVSPYLLPLFLHDFAKKHPLLKLEVREQTTEEIIRQLKSRDLDIGIVSTSLNDNMLVETELYREPFVLYDKKSNNPKKKVAVKTIDTSTLWLLEEGHCMRTQALQICNLKKMQPSQIENIDFKAGSIDSLIRFVNANEASTLLPYLSTLQLPARDAKHIRTFITPAPVRTIGLVVHRHFVKNKVLELLKSEIEEKIKTVLPKSMMKGEVVKPV
ncbi:MAG: LysR substrate-binding domain-containing protein [Bacteroidota bacterium]